MAKNRDEITFGNGTVTFSRERLDWHASGAGFLTARHVTETAPNGGIYVRLASPIEDELLDRIAELEAALGYLWDGADVEIAAAAHDGGKIRDLFRADDPLAEDIERLIAAARSSSKVETAAGDGE